MREPVQVSFAGSGGMYHYYLGIAKVLQDNFYLDNVIFGGTSGGCFPALLLVLGRDIDAVHYSINRTILEEAADSWLGSLFRWNGIARKHMLEYLDPDSYLLANGKLHVSITRVKPWGNEIVSEWLSNEDMINCIQCSSFIPLIFEPKIWHWYRDAHYIDGGLTNNKVHLYPDMPHVYITTTMWREANYNWLWCYSDLMWAEQLYKWGKEDAMEHLLELAEHLEPLPDSEIFRMSESIVLE